MDLIRVIQSSGRKSTFYKMSDGYLYCFSHPLRPGVVKVGMTDRSPEIRLKEANSSTWTTPEFKIEFAKKVHNASEKEKEIHDILEEERVHPRREFFRISPEKLRKFFNLMDGEMWGEIGIEEDHMEFDTSSESASRVKHTRDMTKCFVDGRRIRHKINTDNIWIGTYDYSKNRIVHEGTLYTSLSAFAVAHHKANPGNRKTNAANGWKECEYEVNGEWKSTYSLGI